MILDPGLLCVFVPFVSLCFLTTSTRDALVGVLRAEADKQFHGLRKRLNAFPGAVRDIGHRHSILTDKIDPRAFGHEVKNHFVIAPGGCAVQRGIDAGVGMEDAR